jgi:hypothetical protein
VPRLRRSSNGEAVEGIAARLLRDTGDVERRTVLDDR